MIGKITKGASGRGLIRYLFGPGKANEHRDQRVIAAGWRCGPKKGRTLSAGEIADLGAALDAANDSYGKNPTGGHIWHVSLSLPHGGSTHRSTSEWAEIAQRSCGAGFRGRRVSRRPGWRSGTGPAHRAISTSTSPHPWSDSMAAG